MEMQGIPPAIVFNKKDLGGESDLSGLAEIYRASGYPIYFTSIREGEGLADLMEILRGRTTVLCGPSGVGKSSLSNFLQKDVTMEVGEISKKLGRGKNTTRHAALLALGETPPATEAEAEAFEKKAARMEEKSKPWLEAMKKDKADTGTFGISDAEKEALAAALMREKPEQGRIPHSSGNYGGVLA